MPITGNFRIVLWILFVSSMVLNYQMWQHDYAPVETASAAANASTPAPTLDSGEAPVASSTAPSTGVSTAAGASSPEATSIATAAPTAGNVRIVTDVLDLTVSLAGGELLRADLPTYPQAKNTPNLPVRLFNRDSQQTLYVLQSGLVGSGNEAAPTHQALYTSTQDAWQLGAGQDTLTVPLRWSEDGVTVTKNYVLHRGSYQIDVSYHIQNDSSAPWSYASYARLLRYNEPVKTSYFHPDTYAYKGPAYFNGEKFEKLNIQKGATLDESSRNGWIAALQHDFVTVVVPPAGENDHYLLQTQGNQFLLKETGPTATVAAGAAADTAPTKLFVGPKLQTALDVTNPKLDLVADYGTLRIIATPLFWLMQHVHGVVGNWGFTIIIVTLLLKLIFYPLSEASGRSMAKMKALSPRLNALRETYADDREKLNRAMMELYQKEKVNPLAGCLPMLIQFPIFLAFYWVLRDSVEMRQAPFVLWINDLSSRDPRFVLPTIMAAAMFVQYKLNPQVGDPMQQRVFMIMPLAMSVTFAFFPAGLVLYWVTNTILSILQQWNINRRIATAPARDRR